MNIARYVVPILRVGFGLILIFSGIMKMAALDDFATALENFGLIPMPFITTATVLIPALEILSGLVIAFGIRLELACMTAIVMLSAFTAVIVAKLSEGADVSCACFGSLSDDRITIWTLARNLVLLSWGLIIYSVAATQTPSWKSLQKVGSFVLVFFLVVEVLLLSVQNRVLKTRMSSALMAKQLLPGEKVAVLRAADLNGTEREIELGDGRSKTLLYFLSTECMPCQLTLPGWQRLASELAGTACQVIGVSFNDSKPTRDYVLANGVMFQTVVARDPGVAAQFKVHYTPMTVLIDESGMVERVWMGILDENGVAEILSAIQAE